MYRSIIWILEGLCHRIAKIVTGEAEKPINFLRMNLKNFLTLSRMIGLRRR